MDNRSGRVGLELERPFHNQVVSAPANGGGYPIAEGADAPVPGTCRAGLYNSNRSESWLAVQPGTEKLVGSSKFFFEKWSTFYDFHLGSYSMPNGSLGPNVQIPGYDCVSNGGTQAMPPDWTNNTDPSVDFDNEGRAYQVTLPFNAYWTNLHPNGAIGVVYSDDLGQTWHAGNGGNYLTQFNNSTSLTLGDVVDKQWVAVNRTSLDPRIRDSVYAMWAVFNGFTVEVDASVSRDRGQTFSKPVRITLPNTVGPSNTYILHGGAVGVAFYDRRQACPEHDQAILPADQGRQNLCIDVSLQAYEDSGSGAVLVGGNVDISKFSWDPEQPGQKVGGLSQYPCAAHADPCPNGAGFIGDYFGLAISDGNFYTLGVTTHDPSGVRADGGGRVYYQQQVLATVGRSQFGL